MYRFNLDFTYQCLSESERSLLMRSMKRILAPTCMIALLMVVIVQLAAAAGDRFDALAWFDPIQDVLLEVRKSYFKELDDAQYKNLQGAAIDGMLKELGDPYTNYIPKQEQGDFDKNVRGRYVGIGASVELADGWLTIVSPMAGSPALEAGIRAGDQVRAIDGVTTKDEPIDKSINRLMGNPNTKVVVTVHRQGAPEDETEEVTVSRGQIQVSTVEGVHRVGQDWDYWLDRDQKLAYIRIRQFTETTSFDLYQAATSLVKDGVKGLVLDLRFNPGGSLQAAIEISDMLINDGVIVSVKGREVDRSYSAHKDGTLPDFPMVVLVNSQSASASEIVSGALQDDHRAIILGTRSFGKGLVQDVRTLHSGAGQLKITTAQYYLPSGRNLHKWPDSKTWGVDPDPGFFVPMTNDQYRAMLDIRNDLGVIREGNEKGDWANAQWVEDTLKDPQLSAAIKALRLRNEKNEWVATGQEMKPSDALIEELHLVERQRDFYIEQLDEIDERLTNLNSFIPDEDKKPVDLIPDDQDIAGGTVEVRDAAGKLVATLRIKESGSLEPALRKAGLEPAIEEKKDN